MLENWYVEIEKICLMDIDKLASWKNKTCFQPFSGPCQQHGQEMTCRKCGAEPNRMVIQSTQQWWVHRMLNGWLMGYAFCPCWYVGDIYIYMCVYPYIMHHSYVCNVYVQVNIVFLHSSLPCPNWMNRPRRSVCHWLSTITMSLYVLISSCVTASQATVKCSETPTSSWHKCSSFFVWFWFLDQLSPLSPLSPSDVLIFISLFLSYWCLAENFREWSISSL